MKTSNQHQWPFWIFGFVGVAVFIAVFHGERADVIIAAFAAAGWGLVGVIAFHLLPLLADAFAWQILIPRTVRPSLVRMLWMRWIGESVSTLLPATQVGGDIVRARIASLRGVPALTSTASVLVDITLSIFTQILFTVAGLTLLADATKHTVARPMVAGALLGLLGVGAFYAVQRLGVFRLIGVMVSRISHDPAWRSFVDCLDGLDREIRALYQKKGNLAASAAATLCSWLLGAGEVWIALTAMGVSGGLRTALILESVTQGVRAVMFFVPGAIGFQEGGYVVTGAALGIPHDVAMALALIRRVRELAIGIPGLIAWQVLEVGRVWQAARTTPAATEPLDVLVGARQ